MMMMMKNKSNNNNNNNNSMKGAIADYLKQPFLSPAVIAFEHADPMITTWLNMTFMPPFVCINQNVDHDGKFWKHKGARQLLCQKRLQ